MKFTPMYDLESLTEPQRQEYYLSACEYFKVPPELNLLAFIWMDAGDGKRNLVLYAKKGATDIIRGNLGISTIRLTKDSGPGYVAWITEGKDQLGRIEQAVGSASTEGLKGQSLATAVMIAQTRATRRMTLQFVGGGLLDESEVNTTVTDINRFGANLATLAAPSAPIQPSVRPNIEPGVDITAQNSPKEGISLQSIALIPLIPTVESANAALEQVKEKRKQMTAPAPFSNGGIIPKKVETIEQVAELPPAGLIQIESAPKTRRRRRSKAEMEAARASQGIISLDSGSLNADISESTSESQGTPPPEPVQMESRTAEQAVNNTLTVENIRFLKEQFIGPNTVPYTEAIMEPPAQDLDMPTKDELIAWRAKMFVYTNDILPKAGMKDGVIWRVRKYVTAAFPTAPNANGVIKLTNQQWKDLIQKFEVFVTMNGPEGLVKAIEEVAAKT
jgi:hypothetical protein